MDESAEHGEHPSRYDFSGQRHMLISTCGFWTHEGNYQSIVEMFSRNYGKDGFSTLFAGQGGFFSIVSMPDAANHELYDSLKPLVEKYISIVRRAGSEWASGKISDETSKLLTIPVMPKEDYEKATNASV
jgi:hypothetical protein